jgi:hypothetical protein
MFTPKHYPLRLPRLALVAALAALTAAVALPSVASAETATDCQAKISTLQAQTEGVAIAGRNADKDRAGLRDKLHNASVALGAGKNADAVQKLDDFTAKVQQLEAAGHISSADSQSLTAGANDAIACINSPYA